MGKKGNEWQGLDYYRRKFEGGKSLRLNEARMQHLAHLSLPLKDKTVLEVGAGIGLLTSFFEQRGCAVHSTEGRPGNIQENLRRHPWRAGCIDMVDLMIPGSHDRLGSFDIVFCYGILYHTASPAMVIADLSKVCDSLFLLSTQVACKELKRDWPIHRRREGVSDNQSLHQRGCRPQRRWVWDELRKHFEYVYVPQRPPDHSEYPDKWPAKRRPRHWPRAVFVASRVELPLSTLSNKLL